MSHDVLIPVPRCVSDAVDCGSEVGLTERSNVVHERTLQSLVQRVYEQRLMDNVKRGAYVECMIELALRERHPGWRLTEPWAAWDLEHDETHARIEIKQSAALQPWSTPPDPRPREQDHDDRDIDHQKRRPDGRFRIEPHEGYSSDDGVWIDKLLQRHADLYVFAWHPRIDAATDHRCPDQWKFFVVAERDLPQDEPLAKSIGVGALTRLSDGCGTECGGYDALTTMVVNVLKPLRSSLKAGCGRPG